MLGLSPGQRPTPPQSNSLRYDRASGTARAVSAKCMLRCHGHASSATVLCALRVLPKPVLPWPACSTLMMKQAQWPLACKGSEMLPCLASPELYVWSMLLVRPSCSTSLSPEGWYAVYVLKHALIESQAFMLTIHAADVRCMNPKNGSGLTWKVLSPKK